MDIITISGKARAGKDTFALALKKQLEKSGEDKVLIIHYADALKSICTNCLGWDGQKDEYGRSLLQNTGALFRQNNSGVWIRIVQEIIKGFGDDFSVAIIPDCRYLDEITEMQSITSHLFTIRIERESFDNGLTAEQRRHPSETQLDDYHFDLIVRNGVEKSWWNDHTTKSITEGTDTYFCSQQEFEAKALFAMSIFNTVRKKNTATI